MLTCFKGFSGFSQPSLSNDKSAKNTNRIAYIEFISIGSIYTTDIYVRGTDIGDIFFVRSACVKDAFVGDAYAKSIPVGNASIIHL